MFNSFSRSWELVKASWAVLRADKELVVFPMVSMIGMIIVSIAFIIPAIAAGVFDSVTSGRNSHSSGVLSVIVGFLFYVVLYSVIFFANTALVGAAMMRLRGENPTLRDGFRIASEHATAILGYAVISATVGVVLNTLSRRAGIVGQIVISIIGFVWNVATYLVVPVLVVEKLGPVDAIKRSAALLKATWGEQLTGNFSMGAVFGLIGVVGTIILGIPLCALSGSNSAVAIAVPIVLMVILWVVIGVVSSTLQGIYTAALYRYATEGSVGDFFSDDIVKNAFRPKP
jgi:hypothetical protein